MKTFRSFVGALLLSCLPAFGQAISSSGPINTNTIGIFLDAKHLKAAPFVNATYDGTTLTFGVGTNQSIQGVNGTLVAGGNITNTLGMVWSNSGSNIFGFPTNIDSAQIVANAITDTKLRDSAGFSVIGKATTGTGDPADIVAGTDTVFGRIGSGNLGFAKVNTNQISAANASSGQVLGYNGSSVVWTTPAGGGTNVSVLGVTPAAQLNITNSENSYAFLSGSNYSTIASNILNAHISASAAITRNKIASGTADQIVINNGSGNLTSEATLGAARFPAVTGDVTSPGGSLTHTIAAGAVTDAKINASGITTRSKLPTPIVYDDEANTFSLLQTFVVNNHTRGNLGTIANGGTAFLSPATNFFGATGSGATAHIDLTNSVVGVFQQIIHWTNSTAAEQVLDFKVNGVTKTMQTPWGISSAMTNRANSWVRIAFEFDGTEWAAALPSLDAYAASSGIGTITNISAGTGVTVTSPGGPSPSIAVTVPVPSGTNRGDMLLWDTNAYYAIPYGGFYSTNQTTNFAPTTLYTIGTESNSVYELKYQIIGAGSTNTAGWFNRALFTNTAGTLGRVSTVSGDGFGATTVLTNDATVSGTNIIITGNGPQYQKINWIVMGNAVKINKAMESPGTCTVSSLTNYVSDDQSTSVLTVSQSVPSIGSVTICQVDITWIGVIGTDSIKVQIRSQPDGGGTQFGGDSDSFQPSLGNLTHSYTFASQPAVTGEFYINLINTGGAGVSYPLDTTPGWTNQVWTSTTPHDWTIVFAVKTLQ